jgi:antitoxin CptB
MSFDQPSSSGEMRRKRLRFRAWHRGMRELDLILGKFVDRHLSGLSEEDLTELEGLLEIPDTTLYRWISGQEAVSAEHDTALFRRLIALAVAPTPR